jgi:hypothetical protein
MVIPNGFPKKSVVGGRLASRGTGKECDRRPCRSPEPRCGTGKSSPYRTALPGPERPDRTGDTTCGSRLRASAGAAVTGQQVCNRAGRRLRWVAPPLFAGVLAHAMCGAGRARCVRDRANRAVVTIPNRTSDAGPPVRSALRTCCSALTDSREWVISASCRRTGTGSTPGSAPAAARDGARQKTYGPHRESTRAAARRRSGRPGRRPASALCS